MVGRMVERGYDPDFAQRCFDQIKGFGEYGFPESHARELRAPRLRFELAQVALSGGVRLRAAELAADGLLRAGADRPRCARAWRRGARGRCECERLGLHAGASPPACGRGRRAERMGLRSSRLGPCARSTACSARRLTGWSARRPYAHRRGAARARRACRCTRSSGSPRPTHSARWASTAAPRCGTRAR